jgi:hypothetical protein
MSRLSSYLVIAALTAAPCAVAFADPAPVADRAGDGTAALAPAATAPTPSDAEKYAAREAKDKKAAEFRGGERTYLYISGGAVGVILLVVLLVILL